MTLVFSLLTYCLPDTAVGIRMVGIHQADFLMKFTNMYTGLYGQFTV